MSITKEEIAKARNIVQKATLKDFEWIPPGKTSEELRSISAAREIQSLARRTAMSMLFTH